MQSPFKSAKSARGNKRCDDAGREPPPGERSPLFALAMPPRCASAGKAGSWLESPGVEVVELHQGGGELKARPGSKAPINAINNITERNLEAPKSSNSCIITWLREPKTLRSEISVATCGKLVTLVNGKISFSPRSVSEPQSKCIEKSLKLKM